ncbi:MAG: cobalamin-dependent protein [Candidatus Hydrogenedentes bacterium]|nr:cobalamin-dependent protein [Candidatus Hydrogenedentota bacterium]
MHIPFVPENLKRGILQSVRSAALKTGVTKAFGETRLAHHLRRAYYRRFPLPEEQAQQGPVILKTQYDYDDCERYSVLLIQVPLPANQRHKRIIPLGISYLASYLHKEQPDINIGILDAQVQSLNYYQILSKIIERKWDVIGIGYWTVQEQFAHNLTQAIKAACPDTVLIHGGVHPTIFPEKALNEGGADYVVLSEGEETFAELIAAVRENRPVDNIKGLAYMDEGNFVRTESRPFIKDLDTLPFPAWHLLPIDKYNMPLHVVGGVRMPIIGSRGCPYECAFCCSPLIWARKVRWRSPRNVLDEMKSLHDQYGFKYFHFWDDNLTLNKKYIRELCTLMIEEKVGFRWIGLDRAEHLNRHPDVLKLMQQAGCVGIEVGVESANPDTLLHIHKNQDIDENAIALKHQKEAGLYPLYTCMAFNPGESIAGYYLQKKFLDEAQRGRDWYEHFHPFSFPLYMGQFSTPYPGTELHNEADKLGIVFLNDPEERYHHRINFIPNSLLDDVPLRTIDKLTPEYYYIYLLAVWTALYTVFDHNNTRDEIADYLYDGWRVLNAVFARATGRLTVRQLAVRISEELNWTRTKSYRMTAFTVYIFAQLGVFRSALHHLELEVSPVCYEIPKDKKWQIIEFLRDRGVTGNNLCPDFSIYRG